MIVGYAEYGTYHNAFRWDSSSGLQDLGRLGGVQSEANGVSEDGLIIVGRTDVNHPNGTRGHAFKWSLANGMVDIHNDNVGSGFSTAYDVSADGKKIVGVINYGGNIYKAFLWTESDGMRKLEEVYSSLISYGTELTTAYKITPNGRFIVGSGYNSATGKSSAYLLDTGPVINVEYESDSLFSPFEFHLFQNYPNPFNPNTKIKFIIPNNVILSEAKNLVTLKVFEVLGNEVAILVNEEKPAGSYEVEFNVSGLPSGVYFYRLQAGDYVSTKKMSIIK